MYASVAQAVDAAEQAFVRLRVFSAAAHAVDAAVLRELIDHRSAGLLVLCVSYIDAADFRCVSGVAVAAECAAVVIKSTWLCHCCVSRRRLYLRK